MQKLADKSNIAPLCSPATTEPLDLKAPVANRNVIHHQTRVEELVQQIKPAIFRLCKLLEDSTILANTSGIIIEGASAAFLGKYFQRVASTIQQKELTATLIDPPSSRILENKDILSAFNQEIIKKKDEIGDSPLVISEFVYAGRHCRTLHQSFQHHGIKVSFGILSANKNGEAALRALGIEKFFVGTNEDSPFGLILGNGALNQIVSEKINKGLEETVRRWDSFDDEGEEALTRHDKMLIIARTEKLLEEIVFEYLASRK